MLSYYQMQSNFQIKGMNMLTIHHIKVMSISRKWISFRFIKFTIFFKDRLVGMEQNAKYFLLLYKSTIPTILDIQGHRKKQMSG